MRVLQGCLIAEAAATGRPEFLLQAMRLETDGISTGPELSHLVYAKNLKGLQEFLGYSTCLRHQVIL